MTSRVGEGSPADEKPSLRVANAPEPETGPLGSYRGPPDRPLLVVVTTRAPGPSDSPARGVMLLTRFWHPRDRRWSENSFESLDHAIRLFVDESGWILRQQQTLDQPHAHELIFEARRSDFTGPTTKEILNDVGLTLNDVAEILDKVDRSREGE